MKFTIITHNHPEGIKGAEAVASAVFLARMKSSKKEIRDFIVKRFHYKLDRTLEEIKPYYDFNETCQQTVPEALTCFLESDDFEDAIRKAIWLGGDSDTLACITGGIAEAFYGTIRKDWVENALSILPEELRSLTERFRENYK